jgi:hypothetical protein
MIDDYFKEKRKKLLIDRWNKLGNVSDILAVASPDYQDPQKYFEDLILNEKDEKLAERRIQVIENIRIQDKRSRKRHEEEQLRKKADLDRQLMLYLTDWTQLADSPLNTEEKKQYRKYRQFLRDFFDYYEKKFIITYDVYTFEQWKNSHLKKD